MSKQYNKLPSELLYIDEEYPAYCFNQACSEIIYRPEQGKKPYFKDEKENRKENPGLNLLLG